jgi:putative transposase
MNARFHSADLRRGRWSAPAQVYFLTATVADREPRFACYDTACVAARLCHDAATWRDSLLLAWVLMPDHWHGLLQVGDNDSLSAAMRRFKGVSALSCNARRQRKGALWQKGFHDHALRCDEDLVSAARYLIANPVRAGLVTRVGDYPFWNAVWL